MLLLRGGYYPSFGKPDDGLGFGPPMMEHAHGSTAIAGITLLRRRPTSRPSTAATCSSATS